MEMSGHDLVLAAEHDFLDDRQRAFGAPFWRPGRGVLPPEPNVRAATSAGTAPLKAAPLLRAPDGAQFRPAAGTERDLLATAPGRSQRMLDQKGRGSWDRPFVGLPRGSAPCGFAAGRRCGRRRPAPRGTPGSTPPRAAAALAGGPLAPRPERESEAVPLARASTCPPRVSWW
ncbi:unnamed protein product [Prorocentrum cordatum]|uniref:Uncharacterized protein n=1 Tax=Prorocentrum cordatum TaxID=2364126 RepID=A0ABN9V1Y9_9DINO|nr:unnamed protein product [Polarella glacialis]